MSFYSAEELMEAEDTFHKQYGQWATIEQRMFYWFHYASDLPEDMARGVFYSSKNFNGRVDMMEAAVDSSAVVAAPSKIAVTALIKRMSSRTTDAAWRFISQSTNPEEMRDCPSLSHFVSPQFEGCPSHFRAATSPCLA